MIRKAIIVALALAAALTSAVWIDSSYSPMRWASYGVNCFDHACTIQHTFYDADSSRIPAKIRPRTVRGAYKWGFAYKFLTGDDREIVFVTVPLYAPLAVFAAYPVIALVRGPLRRYRRRKRALCGACGYDLTRNESGVCPECSTEVERG